MNKQKSDLKFVLVLSVLVSLLFLLSGCGNQRKDEEKFKDKENKEFLNDMLNPKRIYKREIVLLSLKYKIDEEKVGNIIFGEEKRDFYSAIEKGQKGNIVDIFSRKESRESIEQYSKQYNIPTDVIASILIDFRVITQKEE